MNLPCRFEFWASRRTTTIQPRSWSRTGGSSRRPRKNGSHEKNTTPDFPSRAVEYCLREGGITTHELDHVAFYEKPLVKFERLLTTYIACAPRGLRSYMMAMPLWIGDKLWMGDDIRDQLPGYRGEVLFGEHHESHAASAFYPSPFERAAIITIDGVGEWATSSIGVGRGHDIELLMEQRFPHSLGLLYSAFTYFTGFKVNSGEYKVMGLAPYGEPEVRQGDQGSPDRNP